MSQKYFLQRFGIVSGSKVPLEIPDGEQLVDIIPAGREKDITEIIVVTKVVEDLVEVKRGPKVKE